MSDGHFLQKTSGRRGAMNNLYLIVGAACAVLTLLGVALFDMSQPKTGDSADQLEPPVGRLEMFCGASTRPAVEQIVRDYEREYGVTVQVRYGGSNTLLSEIEVSRVGDLFLPADDVYITMAQERGLVKEALPAARQRMVIGVPKDNPKKIHTIDDLLRDDVKTSIGNPDQTAIGNLLRKLLVKSGHWQNLEEHVTNTGTMKPTVPLVATDVETGSADAGIVWDTTVAQFRSLEAIRTPELDPGVSEIILGVLSSSKNPTSALKFARYVTARDRGAKRFKANGFEPVEGDKWAEVPEITFFCGSVNRRAVEPIITEFEKREGVRVNRIYNGCGILTSQMKVIVDQEQGLGFPDTYMACDRYYLDLADIKPMFQEDVDISDTEVVIAVRKGNPKNIQSLEDLTRDDPDDPMRVLIGRPEQCTIGVLTEQLLKSEGVYDEVMKNVVEQTATSAMLVAPVVTGTVDASLAFLTDTRAEADKLDVIRIDSAAAKAVQPFAIARASEHKYLARRLYRAIASSRQTFESAGFHFRLEDDE